MLIFLPQRLVPFLGTDTSQPLPTALNPAPASIRQLLAPFSFMPLGIDPVFYSPGNQTIICKRFSIAFMIHPMVQRVAVPPLHRGALTSRGLQRFS